MRLTHDIPGFVHAVKLAEDHGRVIQSGRQGALPVRGLLVLEQLPQPSHGLLCAIERLLLQTLVTESMAQPV